MCGIVGHIGSLNSLEVVIDGLEALEYRGYDSAGVSLIGDDLTIETYKKDGRLENLKKDVPKNKKYRNGIGHTRWATHGVVNSNNSHPHNGKGFSVVHNGIIENASDLKIELEQNGLTFSTETDSEVFVRLVEYNLMNLDFKEALLSAFKRIEGNNCLVVLNERSKKIYAIKNNAPLACGEDLNSDNFFVSSDPYSLQKYVNTIYFPDNHTLVEISSEAGMIFSSKEGQKNAGYKSEANKILTSENTKGEFEHYMLKEIWEQPELVKQFLSRQKVDKSWEKINFVPQRIIIVACGTAYYAGLLIKSIIEEDTRTPVSVEMASEFRYSNPVLNPEDLALFISQSGETADTLAALELCKTNKVKTLSILNVAHSTIYRESDVNLMIYAGPEIGVASTKAFTLQCLTGVLFSKYLEKFKANKNFNFDDYSKTFLDLAKKIDEILKRTHEVKAIAEEIHNHKGFFFTGRNKNYPIALEGALKLKEIAYVHAEGYASGELKHGPIAMIEESIVNIAYIDKNLYEKTLSNIQEIKTRKGLILSVGKTERVELDDISNYSFPIETSSLKELAPIALNIFGQLLSYYIAKHKGTDIDKPRNLAKSVTVE